MGFRRNSFQKHTIMSTREEGNEALGRDDYELAITIYSRALENNCNDERLYSNRSLAYYRLGDFEKSLKDAEKTVELKTGWEKGHIRKALAMIKLGKNKEDVLECYENGLKFCPTSTVLARAALGLKDGFVVQPTIQKTSNNDGKIKWDEESLAKHQAERGILYGTMKIDHPDTPFLIYDSEKAENDNLIGTIENKDAKPEFVDINELQAKLGILSEAQNSGKPLIPPTFEQKRKELYQTEGQVFLDHQNQK